VISDLWTLRVLQLEPKLSLSQQAYSSHTPAFDTSEDDSEDEGKVLKSLRGKKLESTPTLLDSLALCYLGCLTLRLPVTLGDVHHWVTEGKMPYKRAIRHIPPVMKDRLPAQYHASLDPNATLRLSRLHTAIVDLQISFSTEHGIVWPSLNVPLLLWRYLKDLALPLEVYDATTRLAEILGYDFTLNATGKTKMGVRHLPEAQLVACLVISVKLLYPFTTSPSPETSSELAATVIDWNAWYLCISTARSNKEDGTPELTVEELTNTKEKDVFGMTTRDMDQYMDFYQDRFVDELRSENESSEFRKALYNMFPIESPSKPSLVLDQREGPDSQEKRFEAVRAVQSTLTPAKVVADGDDNTGTVRPGQGYAFWKKKEQLPEISRRFYKEAARIAGLELDMLVNAVFFVEKSIAKWIKGERKKGHESKGMED
jgi:RNA polymerase I-specific transcription initiation factor RRN7